MIMIDSCTCTIHVQVNAKGDIHVRIGIAEKVQKTSSDTCIHSTCNRRMCHYSTVGVSWNAATSHCVTWQPYIRPYPYPIHKLAII